MPINRCEACEDEHHCGDCDCCRSSETCDSCNEGHHCQHCSCCRSSDGGLAVEITEEEMES